MVTPFELGFTAQPDDIDLMGHVNNAVWVRWMEEAATAHWLSLAPSDSPDKHGWVVTRHEIDYKSNARLGETVTARTWIAGRRGLRFIRHVEFLGPDCAIKVLARTSWVMVDLETRRPARLPAELAALFIEGDAA